jgi:hypothetical protein
VEIELVPDPGADDPSGRAARAAIARELASGGGDGHDWGLVPHSGAWRRAALRDSVAGGERREDDRGGSGRGSGGGSGPAS